MKYLISFFLILISCESLYSQCSCMAGASVGGISPLVGTANVGLLKDGHLRILTLFSNSYGDTYYSADSKTLKGIVQDFENSNLIFNIGYGLNEEFTAEAELGYFINKSQTLPTYKLNASGLSHLNLMLKYNLLRFIKKQIEWTVGAGLRIPFSYDDNQPVHLRPSTGAYGLSFQSFLHKGYKEIGLHFILSNRFEYNFANEQDYQYGAAFINSIFVSQNIFDNINGIIEYRNDYRVKDKTKGSKISNSGGYNIILSPQLNYTISNIGISAYIDIPVYKYVYGTQLTNSNTFGIAISWQNKLY